MSDWYWRVIALKAVFVLSCFVSYLRADDVIQNLPFCNPGDPSANNDLIIVSTLDGKLTAFSTQNGIKEWHIDTQPLLSSNLHHVELTAGGKWVRLVPSLRGTLYSLSGDTIEPLPFDAEKLLSSSFKYSDDLVIAGSRETLWRGVEAATGRAVYECGTAGCAGARLAEPLGRDLLVLRRHAHTVRALDPRSGNEKWNFSVAEHQLALSRRECVAAAGPSAAVAVAVAVALPEGVIAIRKPGELQPMWQQKLEAPVAGMWRLHGGSLQHIDVLWEATQALVDGDVAAPPSLYIGLHDQQLYVQESLFYAKKVETAVAAKPVPWKLVTSRPLLSDGVPSTAVQRADPGTLSLITLYGNAGKIGNHGFFLYLQETCDQAVQVSEPEGAGGAAGGGGAGAGREGERHHVHVHVYSLWFWWKEVLLIAISSALLMNLMIWPRFFAPKISPPPPLPLNQEYIVVERHYERPPPTAVVEYSGRYEKDFTPLRCLGRGGFGVVFEARNNIDDCSYAVKRITLPRTESKRERVLREVKVLAKLEHENIVRYFNAWVEEPPPQWQEQRDSVWMKELDGASTDCPLTEESANKEYSSSTFSTSTDVSTPASPFGRFAQTPQDSPLRGCTLLNLNNSHEQNIAVMDAAIRKALADPLKRPRERATSESLNVVFDQYLSKKSEARQPTQSPDTSTSTGTSKTSKKASMHNGGGDDSYIVFEESAPAAVATNQPTPKNSERVTKNGSDDSYIVFEESVSEGVEARPECSADKRLEKVKDMDSWITFDPSLSGPKKKKGHTRHWSLDMCVRGDPQPAAGGSKMYLYIQMQLCLRDSLHDWLRLNRTWESRDSKVLRLFSQIVSAVEYVHLVGLIHRDLKPSNILFAPDGRVKVGDFGLVTAMSDSSQDEPASGAPDHRHTYQVGTALYMSPEQLLGKPYGYKVDIYSLGLILLELLHPFGTEAERVHCLRGARLGDYPALFRDAHPDETELLRLMLSEDPCKRPSATGVRARAPLYERTDERCHFTLPNKAAA